MFELIQYTRENCSACVRMKLHVDNNNDINVEMEERHIDFIGELGLDVQAVPLLVLFKDGEIDDFSVGFKPNEIDTLLSKIIN